MRFMMIMHPGPKPEQGVVPDAAGVTAMMKYNEDLQRAGVLLALDGLQPTSKGARIRFPGGKPVVQDGPFAEAKEVIGGYWMIQVKSKEEAIAWASRAPCKDDDIFIEVRQVYEMSDFSPEVQDAAGESATRLQQKLDAQKS